jgi:membrane protein DedA with SNARE-associated domain/membrane-associated phospholipid phosphatase
LSPGQVIAAVAALLIAAGAIWRRERLGFEKAAVALILAAGLGIYASGLLSSLPHPEELITDLAQALGPWTYALVGTMAFLETGAFVGFVAPGEFTVILGGVIAGQGEIDVVPLIGLTWFCCAAGDSVSYYIGHRLGRSFMLKHGPKVRITRERLEAVERYFERHGGKTIVIGRMLGFVRPIAPFLAGSSAMPYSRFLPYSVIGTGIWATLFCLLGFIFYKSLSTVTEYVGRASLAFGTVVVVVVVSVYAYRRLRHEEERRRLAAWIERQSRRPLLRPIAAVVRPAWRFVVWPIARVVWPQARFVARRLMPGELGLELTTAVAIASVGSYAFVAYTITLAGDISMTPADRELLDLSRNLQESTLVDVAKVFTELASLPVVASLILIGAGLLAWKRRPAELAVLVAGFATIYAGVHLTKNGIDRPRPPDPLVETSGSSFPSGHAAYATTYVAMAFIATRVVSGIVRRTAVLLTGVVLAVAIGASRVYLRAHWFSDVAAALGLGAAVFGLFTAVAIVVVYLRQNGRQAAPLTEEPAPAADRG